MNIKNGLYRVNATISMQRMFSFMFVALICVSCLNARWIYVDAGIGSDITVITFPHRNNERIEDLTGSSFTYLTGPNFNFSLGLRLFRLVVFPLVDYQIMPINKDFYYRGRVGLFPLRYKDCRLYIRRYEYFGTGFIIYPHKRVQIGATLGIVYSHYTHEIIAEGSVDGIAWFINPAGDLSIAYDIPMNNFGLLIGCRYFSAHVLSDITTIFSVSQPSHEVSSFGIFTKIRF